MILIDANLLLYAVNRDLSQHKPAHSWFEKILSSDNPVSLPWVVILAFLRIATNGRVFTRPLSAPRLLSSLGINQSVTALTARLDTGPVASGYPDGSSTR